MLVFVIILVLAALVVQRYTLNQGFEGVDFHQEASPSVVEAEESFEIATTLQNRTRRFLPFIRLNETLPMSINLITDGIEHYKLSNLENSGALQMHSTVYLMPRQRLVRRVQASLPRRGRYFLRGATLHLGDFLGLAEVRETYPNYREVVVMPKAAPIPQLADTLGGFLGDISVNRYILEDPVLTLGFREYTMREPQKMISWTQSARRGQLMVRKCDYTIELSVTVLLNVQCRDNAHSEVLLEHCFSLARSVCELLEEKGVAYDFVTNATAAGALSHWSTIGEGLGPRHFSTILEGLGRAAYLPAEPFCHTLDKAIYQARQGRSYILVTPHTLPDCNAGLNRLQDMTGGDIFTLEAEVLFPPAEDESAPVA